MMLMPSSVYVQMEEVRLYLDRFVLPIILVVGNMTNLANIYLFSQRNLRQNPCSWYFISLSVAHLCMLDILGLSRILIGWMNYDYAANNLVYCKIRSYLFTVSMVLSRQFICLISIDRWLVTSPNVWLRNQSSLRVTRYLIFGSILFWLIYDSHALIGYQTNLFGCYPPAGTAYATFASVDTIVTTLLPTVIMIIFSFLALSNLRYRVLRQVEPASFQTTGTIEQERQKSKRNIQLIRLSLLQVLAFTILNSVWATFGIFILATSAETFGFLNFFFLSSFLNGFGLFSLFLYAAMTFVIYTMASNTFRTECRQSLQRGWTKIKQLYEDGL